MIERPAAVDALDAAQIGGDLGFQRGVDPLAEIVAQQHVFGRDGGVGLELEYPVAVPLLSIEECVGCAIYSLLQRFIAPAGDRHSLGIVSGRSDLVGNGPEIHLKSI